MQGDAGRRQLGNNETACLQHRHINAEREAHGEALMPFGESAPERLRPKGLYLQHGEHAGLWFSCTDKWWDGSHRWSDVMEGYRLLRIDWDGEEEDLPFICESSSNVQSSTCRHVMTVENLLQATGRSLMVVGPSPRRRC